MKKGIRNFFNIIWKQGARQMLMAAAIFLTIFSTLQICGAEPSPGTCAVTNNNDSGPGSLRQCVLDMENGSLITFSDDHIITLDSRIIIEKDLTVDAEGFAVTLQADAMPGVAGHGLLTVSEDAAVTVRNMTLRHGRGTMASAAVQSDGTLTLEDCTVTGNHALYAYDYPGIANTGTLTLIRSVLSDHADGRAVIVNTGPSAVLTVRDSTFRDNGIPGIRNSDGGSVSLSGCTFVNNHTSGCSPCVQMWNGGGTLTADNCTFSGNSTSYEYGGAAVYLANSGDPAAVLTNCTIMGNTASGTYGRSAIAMYSGSVTVISSIVAGTCHSAVTGTYSYFDPAKSGAGNLSPADGDPGVGMPADNGGPTLTCALSPGSISIDAGTGVALSRDQRGYPRDSGNGVDMGAFEFQADPGTDPPTVPQNLTAEAVTGSRVSLS